MLPKCHPAPLTVLALSAFAAAFTSRVATGQSFSDPGLGLGLHATLGFVKDAAGAAKLGGAQLRLRLTGGLGAEVSIDYRQDVFVLAGEERLRITRLPIQGSALVYLFSDHRVQPYVLGGAAFYYVRSTGLGSDRANGTTATSGLSFHAGLGVEVRTGQRSSLYLDLRRDFVSLDSVSNLGLSADSWNASGGFNVYF